MGWIRQKRLVASEKCVISCSQRGSLPQPPPKEPTLGVPAVCVQTCVAQPSSRANAGAHPGSPALSAAVSMETGPAPPALDCKFLQAAARQPGEGAAAPGRARGAAAAPRPHLKEKRARKRRWRRRRGEEEENEKERGEEEKEEEEERGEEKETEPERRRKSERGRKRGRKGVFLALRFSSPFPGPSPGLCALSAAALSRRSWELGGIVRSSPAAAASGAGLGEGGGSPPSAAPGAPSPVAPSSASLPRASRREKPAALVASRRGRHCPRPAPTDPGPALAGRPRPSALRLAGARPASALPGLRDRPRPPGRP
ncbi:brain acid soluble protein 1-like [Muntiacus reevesi]|uniref:brain acid soluble protein 1-like n=1 Tax=Muntiacus reevesi TaxID=9886 RepID=UPI003306D0BD